MKKNILLAFVLMVLVLFGTGCTTKEKSTAREYEIYYLDRSENHIMSLPYETATPKAEKDFLVKELLMQLGTQLMWLPHLRSCLRWLRAFKDSPILQIPLQIAIHLRR